MRRPAVSALALLLLAGCPLPQPLPDYPAGTITPPRILQESLWPPSEETLVLVPDNCGTTEPQYTLEATIYDANTIEQVAARWFVDYEPFDGSWTPVATPPVPPDPDPLVLMRTVPVFVFRPYNYPPRPGSGIVDTDLPYSTAGTLHVVELLVSNSFHDPAIEATPPWRGAAANFETQLHRWTFLVVSGLAQGCGPNVRPPPPLPP